MKTHIVKISKLLILVPKNLCHQREKRRIVVYHHILTYLQVGSALKGRQMRMEINGKHYPRFSYNMLQFTDRDFCRTQWAVFFITTSDTEIMH